jgi:hypothetical protein
VAALYLLYEQSGLHNWIDMRQKVLTLEGMRQGVRDSSVFILVLSKHVLGSCFCQQEMLCAIEEEKPIQLIVEQEPRFNPFDIVAWTSAQSEPIQMTTTAAGTLAPVPSAICQMVDDNLPNAVTYRRRDFEVDAMMRELCHRNGLVVPRPAAEEWPAEEPPLRVFVICASESAGTMLGELRDALAHTDRILLTQEPADLATADRILLLLTAGVLSGLPLVQLVQALDRDKGQQEDRIVAMYSSEAGWQFGCEEQRQSSEQVQACLNNHEAITYRAPKPEGSSRHEFPAMVAHLVAKLGAAGAVGGDESREEAAVQPIAGVRDRLAQLETRLVKAEMDAQEAIMALKKQLSTQGRLAQSETRLVQSENGAQEAAATLEEQLAAKNADLAAKDADLAEQLAAKDADLKKQLAAKDAELEELRAKLCDALSQAVDEGVPPV